MSARNKAITLTILLSFLITGCGAIEPPSTPIPPTDTPLAPTATLVPPTSTARPSDTALPPTAVPPTATAPASTEELVSLDSLLSLISQERLFASLEELTTIQPYSGWRNSATEGEAEAQEYVADTLDDLAYLQTLGLELERSSFHVFLATELWDTRLYLTTQGQETEVPADAPRGHRHDVTQALRFDSDGVLNDSERNPVEVQGDVVLLRLAGEIDALQEGDLEGKIVFLDYGLIDLATSAAGEGIQIVSGLIENGVAGLVLVTQFSTVPGESYGRLVGDGAALERVTTEETPPILYARLEDLAPAGISDWQDLAQIEAARLVWDTDVFSPGTSGNLVARIPGVDSSLAIILGAHIDSPNSPGAIDNGINSVALLEVARILNQAQVQPEIDLYLVWFGSEELWLYGSQHFVNAHQELLDRTVAAFVMDGIIGPLPGDYLELAGWPHSRFGSAQLALPRYLARKAGAHDIPIDQVADRQGIGADKGSLTDSCPRPALPLAAKWVAMHTAPTTPSGRGGTGSAAGTVTAMALLAALETGRDRPELRVTPEPERRALILASHTEVVHMTPTTLVDLDRALAWEGFDVDVIPYGQAVTPGELADADLVVVLPVIDYPGPGGDLTLYDEAWSEQEIESLLAYVEQGGLLVLANSAHRLQLFGLAFDENEDWEDMNDLSERFGVVFEDGPYLGQCPDRGTTPPDQKSSEPGLDSDNGIPFTMQAGETLAQVNGRPAVGLVEYGEAGGQVLVLADVGILGFAGP